MSEFGVDVEEGGLLKARHRSCLLAPCTCGSTTENAVSIHFFIILVASLQSFSVFLFAGTPRDSNGVLTASIGCALSLLPLPFLLFALYGIVYNRPNLILVLVIFLIILILMYIALLVLDLHFQLLALPHFAFVLIALSTLHAIHAIRVMLRQRAEMIERNRGETAGNGLRLEKVVADGRDMLIYAQ